MNRFRNVLSNSAPFVPLLVALCLLASPAFAAFLPVATTKQVTNTKGGKNQNPSVDKKGGLVVFTSNTNHVAMVTTPPTGAFDFDETGTDFTPIGATPPNPSCANCTAVDNTVGNLYLWRLKKSGAIPANSITQLTFSTSGGFTANQLPDIDTRGQWIAWDSIGDHTGGNADGNREIFLMEVATGDITQITTTTSGGGNANRSANLSDRGRDLVFDSDRDFASLGNCTLGDGVTACDNADGNSEIMIYDREADTYTQVTSTTADGNTANVRARISNDGGFVAFQSTRDFSGVLPGGATCVQLDGVTGCTNDNNAEIMLYERATNAFTQITDTINGSGCSGATSSERVEISKRGKYVTFQSKCEDQLNPAGCGDCNNNDEVFLAEMKKGNLVQVTTSDAGFNRVPRISGTGGYIVFESNRSYRGLNAGHNKTLYILRRRSSKPQTGLTSKVQLEEDATLNGGGIVQNPKTLLTTIDFTGGFNSSVEQFGVSANGRMVAFDNAKGVGNQEIWLVDRKK